MNMTITPRKIAVSSVTPGNVFKARDAYWIRVKDDFGARILNLPKWTVAAVNLNGGELEDFESDEEVIPCAAQLEVTE